MGILVLSSLLLLLHSPASLPVTVSTSKPKVEVHEHSDAVLACEFRTESEPAPRIEWKKKGKDVSFVYFEGKFIGSFAGRAHIDGATVTLHSVTQKDSGVYRCEVSAPLDKVILGEVNVSLNVLVELHCKDKLSVPPATYRWYKDNKALTVTPDSGYNLDSGKGTLKFKSVSRDDSGLYRCEAFNSVGAPKSCVAQHLKVIDYQLSLTTLVAGAVGLFLLVFMCCLGVCLCHRRGCCRKEKTVQSSNFYNPPPPPPIRNPKTTNTRSPS
ncbi:junctional adhesion molecule 2b [Hypomesus transpacificus]|uniref:junctional adhesion molecule 2b n=1 Tax=Hypomesus transpacificus TaxID=137520 RepID=UPI001F07F9CF|nr:junctional adhesion molecule 2b [Hypomesus transpacificus]